MCCGLIFRCAMYGIAIFTAVVGVSILSLGSALTADVDAYLGTIFELAGDAVDSSLYESAVYLMIPVGILLICTGVFGFCGAWRGQQCCLLLFNIITGCVIALIIVSGVLAAVYKDSLDPDALEETFVTQVQESYGTSGAANETITENWDIMQYETDCCGANGPADYENSEFNLNTNNSFPESCCVDYDGSNSGNYPACLESGNAHQKGCADTFEDQVNYDADVVMGVCFSLGILNAIGIFLACCIKGKLEEENTPA